MQLTVNQKFPKDRLAKLPKNFYEPGFECEALGWGADNLNNTITIEKVDETFLQEAVGLPTRQIIPNDECETKIKKQVQKSEEESKKYSYSKICMYDFNSITGQDVGGPLICNEDILQGVIDNYFILEDDLQETNVLFSFRPRVTTVFIDIGYYLLWIEDVVSGTKKVPRSAERLHPEKEGEEKEEKTSSSQKNVLNPLLFVLLLLIN